MLLCTSHFYAIAQQSEDSNVDADANNSEVIEVRGLRSSLDRAKLLKRDAATVIEAITSEDICLTLLALSIFQMGLLRVLKSVYSNLLTS